VAEEVGGEALRARQGSTWIRSLGIAVLLFSKNVSHGQETWHLSLGQLEPGQGQNGLP
jgi:hypothetical protein